VHPDHFEGPQLLRYKPGQYYRAPHPLGCGEGTGLAPLSKARLTGTHHDADGQKLGYGIGSRVFTAFIYLSDVEEGGVGHAPARASSVLVAHLAGPAQRLNRRN